MTDGFVFARSEATWQSTVLSPIFWFFVGRIAHHLPLSVANGVQSGSFVCFSEVFGVQNLLVGP